MKRLTHVLTWLATTNAVSAWTLTPLTGFLVGDKQPSIAATALHMLIAVVFALAALLAAVAHRFIQRRKCAAEIQRRAIETAAHRNPVDRFAAVREQALDAGLPWVEADGTITRPIGGTR